MIDEMGGDVEDHSMTSRGVKDPIKPPSHISNFTGFADD